MKHVPTVIALLFTTCALYAASAGDSILGKWKTAKSKAGQGVVVATKTKTGYRMTIRGAGKVLAKGLCYNAKQKKWRGKITDPRNGNVYDCVITISDDKKTLFLRGFVGVPLFGKTTEWIRVR